MKLRTGKAASSVLDRSVYKRLGDRYRPEEIAATLAIHPITRSGETAGFLSVISAANDLAGTGVCPKEAQTTVLLPLDSEEALLREMEDQIRAAAVLTGIKITGGWTEVTPAVTEPVVITAISGEEDVCDSSVPASAADHEQGDQVCQSRAYGSWNVERTPGTARRERDSINAAPAPWHVIIAGQVGLEGTCIIASERAAELRRKFPGRFLDRMLPFWQELYVGRAADIICGKEKNSHEAAPSDKAEQQNHLNLPGRMEETTGQRRLPIMTSASAGGIFAALWNFSERAGRQLRLHGFELDLLKIPIAQETVEIANCYDLNPYELASAGSLIAAVQDPDPVVRALREQGICAAEVGILTEGHDRLLRNQDEVRYLDPPAPDALLQLQRESLHAATDPMPLGNPAEVEI